MILQFCVFFPLFFFVKAFIMIVAQSAGAAEYINYISTESKTSTPTSVLDMTLNSI